jgi:hypothetical protein
MFMIPTAKCAVAVFSSTTGSPLLPEKLQRDPLARHHALMDLFKVGVGNLNPRASRALLLKRLSKLWVGHEFRAVVGYPLHLRRP